MLDSQCAWFVFLHRSVARALELVSRAPLSAHRCLFFHDQINRKRRLEGEDHAETDVEKTLNSLAEYAVLHEYGLKPDECRSC